MDIGILGFAHGHVHAYCRQWFGHPEMGVRVVKGWDHDQARLATATNLYGLTPCDSAEQILSDPAIGAVVITSETSMHARLAVAAAAAGKAIIMQKPMALTISQADEIISAVQRHQVPFTMAWQMRVDPQNLQIKQLLDQGVFGQLFQFRRRHSLGVCFNPEFAKSWHVSPSLNRDLWADDAAHPIDLIYWLFGMPSTVTAELTSLYDQKMPNDNGIAIFRYENGPLVEVNCSFVSAGAEQTTEMYGEKGFLTQSYGDAVSAGTPRAADAVGMKYFLRQEQSWTNCDIPSPNSQNVRIEALAKPLADFLHGRRPALASDEEGKDVLRLVLATYVSHERGQRVSLNDPAIDAYPEP